MVWSTNEKSSEKFPINEHSDYVVLSGYKKQLIALIDNPEALKELAKSSKKFHKLDQKDKILLEIKRVNKFINDNLLTNENALQKTKQS